jgi:hypothetical protein
MWRNHQVFQTFQNTSSRPRNCIWNLPSSEHMPLPKNHHKKGSIDVYMGLDYIQSIRCAAVNLPRHNVRLQMR